MPYHNVEKSAFQAGHYIGWRASDGAPYTITPAKRGAPWRAYRRDATAKLQAGDVLTSPTLRGISERLAQS